MSYNPKTWVNGETIYAAGLNAMEQGIQAAAADADAVEAAVGSASNGTYVRAANTVGENLNALDAATASAASAASAASSAAASAAGAAASASAAASVAQADVDALEAAVGSVTDGRYVRAANTVGANLNALDAAIVPGGGSGLVFSTQKVDTGWIWIDGKHIFAQVFTATSTSTSAVNLGNIPNLYEVIAMIGAVRSIGNNNWRSLDSPAPSTSNYVRVMDSGNVEASSTVSGSKKFTATVYFTEST